MTAPLTTPRRDGFRMPAEWEPHSRCWMGWPFRPDVWREKARPAREAFAMVAGAISAFEPVTVCVPPGEADEARRILPDRVEVFAVPCDDAWLRDTGPTFVTDGRELRGVDWEFNSWGGLLAECRNDNALAGRILRRAGAPAYRPGIVMEGGSFSVDGEGTVIATEECLLNPNRNPHLSRQQIEETLLEYVGAQKMIWIPRGMLGDSDTSGHVDNICCFVRPGVVALAWTSDSSDPRHTACSEAEQALQTSTDARGRALQVVRVPLPPPQTVSPEECRTLPLANGQPIRSPGQLLPASYINFYFANGALIVPAFGDQTSDGAAAEVFTRLFPDRKIQMIPSREILLGGGNIHCITQQQPEVA
ncbi:MAG: agmatine deiminase [Armatimonadota bacterium]